MISISGPNFSKQFHKRCIREKTDLFEQISVEIIPFTHFILILVLCSIRKVVLIKPLTKSVRLQRRMSGLYATKHTYFKKKSIGILHRMLKFWVKYLPMANNGFEKSIERFIFHEYTDTIAIITLLKPDIILYNLTEYNKRTWVSDSFFVPPKH